MRKFNIYGTPVCGYCRQAKSLCEQKGLEYDYFDLGDLKQSDMDSLMENAGIEFRSVPQIFEVKGDVLEYIGGFTELKAVLS
jgi:glutaredoxin 1